jgi:hypothetical protein
MWCIDGRDVTFLCGRAGVSALGAVAAKHTGDEQLLDYYLAQFREVPCSLFAFFNLGAIG